MAKRQRERREDANNLLAKTPEKSMVQAPSHSDFCSIQATGGDFPLLDTDHNEKIHTKRFKEPIVPSSDIKSGVTAVSELRLSRSERLCWHVKRQQATVLFIKIEGLDSACTALSLKQIVEMTAQIYQHIYEATLAQGVTLVEPRRNSFLCMLTHDKDEQTARLRFQSDKEIWNSSFPGDKVRRMLALAADIHQRLRTAPLLSSVLCSESGLGMGIASGATTMMDPDSAGARVARTSLCVRGDAADVAQEMAEASVPGTVVVHESALWRWAAAARRLPPATVLVESRQGERRRAGAFDLEARAFRPLPAAAAEPATASGARRLRRSASFS
jgi:class 3 adenylate cyclase